MEEKLYGFIRNTFNLAGTATGVLLLVIYLLICAGLSLSVFYLTGERSYLENPDGFRLSHFVFMLGAVLWLALFVRLLFLGGLKRLNQNYDMKA